MPSTGSTTGPSSPLSIGHSAIVTRKKIQFCSNYIPAYPFGARHILCFGCVLKGPGTDEGEPVHPDTLTGSHISKARGPPGLGVRVKEFVSLLEHLYHDTPLSSKSPFSHVASILRVSSPSQLEFPSLHALVRSYLEAIFPSGPLPFMHPDHLEEALALMTAYDIRSN
ncbi:hypothetical protein BKA82DRAFT_2857639 [Pisolithus tinctorius]|nr:hypothetical protein BKA82DRAFT_2857639 [Pisolithus tinctorius]